jgi:hypothetical protein
VGTRLIVLFACLVVAAGDGTGREALGRRSLRLAPLACV